MNPIMVQFPFIPEETPSEYGRRLAQESYERALKEVQEEESKASSTRAE